MRFSSFAKERFRARWAARCRSGGWSTTASSEPMASLGRRVRRMRESTLPASTSSRADCRASSVARSSLASAPASGLAFSSLGFGISGGLGGIDIASEIVGILMSSAGSLSAGSYRFGVPQFAEIPLPRVPVGDTYTLEVSALLPPVVTPYGNVTVANLAGATIDAATGDLLFDVVNASPGVFGGSLVVRALFGDRTFRDVATIAGDFTGSLRVSPPSDLAIGSAVWQLVRQVATSVITASGLFSVRILSSSAAIRSASRHSRTSPPY